MVISIVTAVYNRVDTIQDAMQSLQSQSYIDVEHIIQDGVSDDGTLAAIAKMADARTSVQSTLDKGIYDALNRGIARTHGDIVGVLHSDDIFAHDSVLEHVAAAFDNTKVEGVYGDLEYVAKDDPSRVIRYWRAGHYKPEMLRRGWMPPHPTLFLRREVFERHGAYDTSFRIAADYDAMLRWFTNGNLRLAYIPDVLVRMRVGGESNRSIGRIFRKTAEDYRALRKNGVGGIGALVAKNISKIPQFVKRVQT
jgi:glycosyltransferase involved in cell wall biosynthesis